MPLRTALHHRSPRLAVAAAAAAVLVAGLTSCTPAQNAAAYFRDIPGGQAKAACIINRESGGNPNAISATHDYGLFQINRAANAAEFDQLFGGPFDTKALDPTLNARYARWLYDYWASRGRSGWSPWAHGRYPC